MSNSPNLLPQYIATLCATIGAMGMGASLGFSSPAGAILTSSNRTTSDLYLTDTENSWFSSISNLGAAIGSPLAGFLINYYGRRGTIILSVIPATIGWILIISGQNFAMLIIGRIFSGIYYSFVSVTIPTYIGEFSSPHIRGTLGGSFQLMSTSGILFAYCMGAAFDNFRWIAFVCAIFPCICSFLMFFNRETPNYLLSKGHYDKAVKSLEYFRGKNYNGIPSEIEEIQISLDESKNKNITLKDLMLPHNLKPLLIVLGVMFFQQFCGINAVLFNLVIIFETVGSRMSENMSGIIIGIMLVMGTVLSLSLVDKAGRKILLIVSSAVMTVSLSLLGIFFYYNLHDPLVAAKMTWLPLVALIVFIIAFSIGYGPISWLMMSEVFSPEIKDLASSISSMVNFAAAFVVTLIFVPLQEAIHDYGVYWLFAGFSFLSLIFVVVFVYETKGKTLQEINRHFGGPQTQTPESIPAARVPQAHLIAKF